MVPSGVTLNIDASALLPGTVVKLDKAFVLHVPVFDQCMLASINGYELGSVPVDVAHDHAMSKLTIVCSHRTQGSTANEPAVDER